MNTPQGFRGLYIFAFTAIVLGVLGGAYWYKQTSASSNLLATAEQYCADGKSFTALYYEDLRADLSLSDGRKVALKQTQSHIDTSEYSSLDGSFVLRSNPDGKTITEKGVETFSNCYYTDLNN